MSGTLEQKVARMEETLKSHTERIDSHERKLDAQSEKNEALTRLIALFEAQERANAERERRQEERDRRTQEQMDKFGEAMEGAVTTLTTISDSQRVLGERVSTIEITLQGQKIDPISWIKGILIFVATALGTYLFSKLLK